jgi:hypothetical protein
MLGRQGVRRRARDAAEVAREEELSKSPEPRGFMREQVREERERERERMRGDGMVCRVWGRGYVNPCAMPNCAFNLIGPCPCQPKHVTRSWAMSCLGTVGRVPCLMSALLR